MRFYNPTNKLINVKGIIFYPLSCNKLNEEYKEQALKAGLILKPGDYTGWIKDNQVEQVKKKKPVNIHKKLSVVNLSIVDKPEYKDKQEHKNENEIKNEDSKEE